MKNITTDYPAFIKKFPTAGMPNGQPGPHFLNAEVGQVAFHTIEAGQRVPLHSHDDAWAILVSGDMQVTVGAKNFEMRTGDSWYIPSGVKHGGKAIEKSLLVEVFCEKRFVTREE
jgi:quercetin dioxygenase-like cupin family protein